MQGTTSALLGELSKTRVVLHEVAKGMLAGRLYPEELGSGLALGWVLTQLGGKVNAVRGRCCCITTPHPRAASHGRMLDSRAE